MYLIGLTGGIAAGKSTVAKLWCQLGAIEIDADQLAREVVEPGTEGLRAVAEAFGNDVLDDQGRLDRERLAQIVFSDESERRKLEEIVHPLVQKRAVELLAQQPSDAIVVYNVPLLVEAESMLPFDKVVTVEAPIETRVTRLVEERGLTQEQARARIEAQASSTERANQSDVILNSNQDLALLLKDATVLWRQIEREAQVGAN